MREQVDPTDRLEVGALARAFHAHGIVEKSFGGRSWSREQVSLDHLTADGLEELELRLGLHALCERAYANALGHVHNRAYDLAGMLVLLQAAEEGHVYFQYVELIVLEQVERAVAASEVVHPDLVSRLADALHLRTEELVGLVERGLRDLYVEQGPVDAVFVDKGLYLAKYVAELKVQAREVYGCRHYG